MGQSMGSIGNAKKQAGAGNQKKNQPEEQRGQKVSDQDGHKTKGKPDGGADKGPRSVR